MAVSLPIGDFSRATHMSVKALRYYHRVGLLEPADVDPFTGHRRYTADQIPVAQVIRRFRDLDMPLEEIKEVLVAPDVRTRNDLITAHLDRLEASLARTQGAVATLRDLLGEAGKPAEADVSHRSVPAVRAAAVTAVVDVTDIGAWYHGALGELRATLAAQGLRSVGPPGGVYATGLFTDEHGAATVFIPCTVPVREVGRVESLIVPAAELAVIVHSGPDDGIDRAYGALAAHVARHALAVEGPVREYYLTSRHDTPDEQAWRTEIGWPIFQTTGPLVAVTGQRPGQPEDAPGREGAPLLVQPPHVRGGAPDGLVVEAVREIGGFRAVAAKAVPHAVRGIGAVAPPVHHRGDGGFRDDVTPPVPPARVVERGVGDEPDPPVPPSGGPGGVRDATRGQRSP